MPRIDVHPVSLTAAARSIVAAADAVASVHSDFDGKTAGATAAAPSPADAALSDMCRAWSRALGQMATSMHGLAHNTEAAAVVYESADRLPPPKPPAPPPEPEHSDPMFPWEVDPDDLKA
jgi:hypothetical protein